MSLADFTPEWHAIKTRKGEGFAVRGLSLDDLTTLIRTNMEDLKVAVATFQRAEIEGIPAEQVLLLLLKDAPSLAAQVIALGAGEMSAEREAKLLPFPLQMDAITNILRLTFEDVGGPKNFFATLLTLAESLGLNLPDALKKPLAKTTRVPSPASTIN